MNLIFSRAALSDLDRLHAFLAESNPRAAIESSRLLADAIQSLFVFPARGRPSGMPGVRELIVPFGASGYVVRYRYRPRANEIVILRVWHAREAR